MKTERSEAFLKGYNACAARISRTHNPYGPTPTGPSVLQSSIDWHEGWNTRFYGEGTYEGHSAP